MTMTICKECRKEISTDAIACPHCGKPLKKASALEQKYIVYGLLAAIVLATLLYAAMLLSIR